MKTRRWLIPAILFPLLPACSAPDATHAQVVRSLLEARQDRVVIQKFDLSCGAAALATVLTYQHGDKVTEREAAAGMLRHTTIAQVQKRLGFSLLDLKRYAQSRGFTADGYSDLTVDDLLTFGPTIVPIKIRGFSHFVIFRGMQGDRVLLADPAYGNRSMPAETFAQMWENRIGFTISRTDNKPAPNMLAANASDFWASSGPVRTAAPVVVAEAAAPQPAAAPAEQASVVAVSNPETQPAAAPPAAAPADHAAAAAGAPTKLQPAPPPRAKQTSAVALPKVQLVAAAAPVPPPAAAPVEQTAVVAVSHPEGQSVATGVPDDTATASIDPLLRRGDELLALGDVSSARRLYERGAAAGDGRAAASVGRTLDPYFLASMSTFGLQPDPQAAASWYRRAIKLGYAQAEAPLRRLSPDQDQ
jgi:predicted double-glycine peptidase